MVGVGVEWSLLRCVGGGGDVRVQMWAAGAAADHSSARVHDVILLNNATAAPGPFLYQFGS